MQPIRIVLGLSMLSAAAACDRPTALEVVNAIERADGDSDPLAGATGDYYLARLGFEALKPAGIEPADLVVALGDDASHWKALVIERRYVRDSLPGRPCADVVRQVVAVRDQERAVLEMGGSDFTQRIRRWDWCGNRGSEDYAAPYLWLSWQRDDRSAQALDGVAHVDPVGQLGGGCEFRHDDRPPDSYRVDCERIEFLVDVSATLETQGAVATPRRVRVEPQIVPGVRFTVHCNEYASERLGVGGCRPPPRP